MLGTVDQIGSRLLFRGYGVSDLDAALVGTDSLVLVDEAHLSTALVDTVTALRQRDRTGVPLPGLDLVRLTATGAPTVRPFVFDVDRHRDDATAWRRLTAAKRLTVQETSAKDCVITLADGVLDRLRALAGPTSPQAPVGTGARWGEAVGSSRPPRPGSVAAIAREQEPCRTPTVFPASSAGLRRGSFGRPT